jgi:hypothetical protein
MVKQMFVLVNLASALFRDVAWQQPPGTHPSCLRLCFAKREKKET